MDEARLAEIEAYAGMRAYGHAPVLAEEMVPELIAEVRRLRAQIRMRTAHHPCARCTTNEVPTPATITGNEAWERAVCKPSHLSPNTPAECEEDRREMARRTGFY